MCMYIYAHEKYTQHTAIPHKCFDTTTPAKTKLVTAAVTHDGADGHGKVNHFLPRSKKKNMDWAVTIRIQDLDKFLRKPIAGLTIKSRNL